MSCASARPCPLDVALVVEVSAAPFGDAAGGPATDAGVTSTGVVAGGASLLARRGEAAAEGSSEGIAEGVGVGLAAPGLPAFALALAPAAFFFA